MCACMCMQFLLYPKDTENSRFGRLKLRVPSKHQERGTMWGRARQVGPRVLRDRQAAFPLLLGNLLTQLHMARNRPMLGLSQAGLATGSTCSLRSLPVRKPE